jgi:hypothetical protein
MNWFNKNECKLNENETTRTSSCENLNYYTYLVFKKSFPFTGNRLT